MCSHTYRHRSRIILAMANKAIVLTYLAFLLLPSANCKGLYIYIFKYFFLGYCSYGAVRLYNTHSTTQSEGAVQYCYSNTWYSVCDYGWDCREANVVCRQLGYDKAGKSMISKVK